MKLYTADICDELGDQVEVLTPHFIPYGGRERFGGSVTTIKLFEDNTDLIELLQEDGKGRVCVVDVGGAYVAVVGENLMKIAYENEWSGIVVNGYVRDITFTSEIDVGLMALGTCPRRSTKKASALINMPVEIGGVMIESGYTLYADYDGIVVVNEL